MSDLKKWAAYIGAALVFLGAFGFFVWKMSERSTLARVAAAPADTVMIEKEKRVEVPVVRVKKIETHKTDTLFVFQPADTVYVARADTVIRGTELRMAYFSPVPLSPQGFFGDIQIKLPAQLVKVEERTITKTVIEERIDFPWIIGVASAGIVAGILIGRRQ